MESQVFLPVVGSRSPVDLQAELVRLRRALRHCQRRTRLAMRSLQEVQALLLGLHGSAIGVGSLAQLIGQVQATRAMLAVEEEVLARVDAWYDQERALNPQYTWGEAFSAISKKYPQLARQYRAQVLALRAQTPEHVR
jgi:transketolase